MENQASFEGDDESTQFREFNLVSFDQIQSSTYSQDEAVYRSITLATTSHVDNFSKGYFAVNHDSQEYNSSVPKPTLQRETFKKTPGCILVSSTSSSGNQLKASEYPDLLMPHNFDTFVSLDFIHSQIESILHDPSVNGISYDFDDSKCQWTVVLINGSNHCKFQVTVYNSKCGLGYLLEGNRLKGDSSLFRTFFSQIKSRLSNTNSDDDNLRDFDSFSISFPLPISPCGDNCHQSLDCLFQMANEPNVEAQCEAARILCDLTIDSSMQQTLVDLGVLTVLRNIICNSCCEWAQQHAMAALNNLSDAQIFQSSIIKEGLLPVLLALAVDGPYQTAELRRSAVHILANLCSTYSVEVAKVLGQKVISPWMNKVDNLIDDRLKFHANRARESLRPALSAMVV